MAIRAGSYREVAAAYAGIGRATRDNRARDGCTVPVGKGVDAGLDGASIAGTVRI